MNVFINRYKKPKSPFKRKSAHDGEWVTYRDAKLLYGQRKADSMPTKTFGESKEKWIRWSDLVSSLIDTVDTSQF